MAASNFDKFKLLLWKNWKLQWNKKFQLVVELLLPPFFSMLLVLVRLSVSPSSNDVTVYNESLPIDNLDLLRQIMGENDIFKPLQYHVAYSPNNVPAFEKIVEEAAKSLDITYSGYHDGASLEKAVMKENYLAGVEFVGTIPEGAAYPNQLSFRLRFPSELRTAFNEGRKTWGTTNNFLYYDTVGPRNANDTDGGIPAGYLREGFLPVQHAISTAFINQLAKDLKEPLPKIFLQRYPYPKYIYDVFASNLSGVLILVILMCYIFPSIHTVKYITLEKEKQLKEVMKMMGIQCWLHWLAWFVKAFMLMAISALLMTIILTFRWSENVAVLTHSSFTALYTFFLFYGMVSIMLCFMIAVCFSKATHAGIATTVIWFFTYLPYLYFRDDRTTLIENLLYSLISNTAMSFGGRTIAVYEANGIGLQWSNIFNEANSDDPLTMAHLMGMMVLDSFIYMMICLYVEQIYPGEFGVGRAWYFPFTKSFWYGEREYIGVEDSSYHGRVTVIGAFEAEPQRKRIGVQVRNLRKTFDKREAVKGLSMNLYENEITVLLGHNGAGKTTTISMLTGMFSPTSGTAIVNGYDIRTNLDLARMSLGICPQYNILFDDLTVRDHLVFYSRLKGLKGQQLEAEVDNYIQKIQLEDKADVASSKLSGGMQRKLSVCCALCGGSKVVLCDEPSSGMDPAARRQLWDLLQTEKKGRTILLTTHFMDEADVLGDRIAIMCAGELKCLGTSFFLKKKYGSGYKLICVKTKACNSADVTKILRGYIPDIEPDSDIGAELSYNLPDRYSYLFEKMFEDLEKHSDELLLEGYGVSITTLEEVFINVGAEMNVKKNPKSLTNGHASENTDSSVNFKYLFSDQQNLLKGNKLRLNQWRSMILKKYLFTIRNKAIYLFMNGIPILMIALTLFAYLGYTIREQKPLKLGLNQYLATVSVLETNAKEGSLADKISQNYKSIVHSHGTTHVLASTGGMDFISYILELSKTIRAVINKSYIAAATINEGSITAWLNNKPLHSAPVTVNLVHNAIAKTVIGPQANIEVINAPLPFTAETTLSLLQSIEGVGMVVPVHICFSMCVVTAMYIMFLIMEKKTRAKLLQFVGGIKVSTFWMSHFVWDFLTFTITAMVSIITLACFQKEGYSTVDELGRVLFMLILFGFSALPLTYLMSICFTEPATGFQKLMYINIIFGCGMFFIAFFMASFNLKTEVETLERIFMVFPHFTVAQGFHKLHMNAQIHRHCEDWMEAIPDEIRCKYLPVCCTMKPYLGWEQPGVLMHITYLSITAVLFLTVLLVMEYRIMDNIYFKMKKKVRFSSPKPLPLPEDGYYDEDVEKEKQMIQRMSSSEIARKHLVLDRVTKFYGRFVAVNQISTAVSHSDCFGLLGVNGAGKTTTFKMLTGDERMTSGDAYVLGSSLRTDLDSVYRQIGYCPQFDAVFDDLTGSEMIRMYSLLRGIPENTIAKMSRDLATSFGFKKYFDKRVGTYSGGNKRKLSTAIALLGSPSVIYLDEPSTGMDPTARRRLWNILCKIRDAGKAIVLTSHSMEECEALCTRLAIMVNGEFKCIGSTQHLKNRFTKGLTLKLKISTEGDIFKSSSLYNFHAEDEVHKVIDFIRKEFPESFLREQFQSILTFFIPISGVLWSKIFGLMERKREELKIEDYSISQTTLEEIFLQFAKYQRDDPRDIKTKKRSEEIRTRARI